MSHIAKTLEVTGTTIYTANVSSRADQISITIQNPPSNTGNVEIAWDDVDTPLVAGNGLVLAPGDRITLGGLPVNAAGKIGILGCTLVAPPQAVRVIVASPTTP